MEQQQMIDLAAKFFLGTLTEEEGRLVDAYLDNCSPSEREAFYHLANEERTLDSLRDWAAMNTDHRKRKLPSIQRTMRWIMSSAAVLLVLVGAYVVWMFTIQRQAKVTGQAQTEQEPILPGGNKARLILAQGQVITLDSLPNGELTRQGNMKIVKLASGQIAYQFGTENPKDIGAAVGMNAVETPVGGQYQVVLPDRTKVWLNASSVIRFPASFQGLAERRVEIQGEAYLEVTKDEQHPFIVATRNSEIRVLGTHFNIMAYREEPAVKTTLYEGSVKVSHNASSVTIKPGQQALLYNDRLSVDPHPDIDAAIAWKEGSFAFAGADIETVMRMLARWYGISVVYEGTRSSYKINGEIARSHEIKEVLRMLEYAGFHFRIQQGKTVVVYNH